MGLRRVQMVLVVLQRMHGFVSAECLAASGSCLFHVK